MQNIDSILQSLITLNASERIGKQYNETYNEYLNHAQYLYINTLPSKHISLSNLLTAKAVTAQNKLALQFKTLYGEQGLAEEDFFHSDSNIEVEKLYRYIHIPEHKHRFIECSYVLSGTCKHIINGNEHLNTAGTFTIILPGVSHELVPVDDSLCLTIKIRDDFFPQLHVPNLPSFVYPLSFSCSDDMFISNLLLAMYQQQNQKATYYDQIIRDLFQVLLTYIMQNYKDSMQILFSEYSDDPTMIQVLNYTYENYQTITLHALASHFHFNDAYLSNRIHKEFHKPFSKILREFKLKQAVELLQSTNLKLDNICSEIGYKDCRQFIRNFKEQYGITPAKYRKQIQH